MFSSENLHHLPLPNCPDCWEFLLDVQLEDASGKATSRCEALGSPTVTPSTGIRSTLLTLEVPKGFCDAPCRCSFPVGTIYD